MDVVHVHLYGYISTDNIFFFIKKKCLRIKNEYISVLFCRNYAYEILNKTKESGRELRVVHFDHQYQFVPVGRCE